MPNFAYTSNVVFKPFTFQEMLAPLAMYTQEHRAIEEAYGDLNTKASVWEGMANEQTDHETYTQYKNYADDLRAQADSLAKNGLNPSSRKSLNDLKARYQSEILPIEQAYAARAKEAEDQYKGAASGIVYEGNAATSSLDRYLGNPQVRYKQANSQEGFKRLATAASALAKGLTDYGRGKNLDSFTGTFLQRHGYTANDIASAIADVQKIMQGDTNVQTNGVLRALLQDEMTAAGVNNWNNDEARLQYFNKVAPALYQGVGQSTVSPYNLFGPRLAAEEASQKRVAAYKKSLDNPQPPTGSRFPIDFATINVGKADKGRAANNIKALYGALGIGNHGKVKVQVGGSVNNYLPTWGVGNLNLKTTNTIDANLFVGSQGGRLKTKQEFMQSGKTAEQKAALGEYYDTKVQPILNRVNQGVVKGANFTNLTEVYNSELANAEKTGISTYIKAISIPTQDISKTLNNLKNQTVWELGEKDGDWIKQKSAGTLNDIIEEANANKQHLDLYVSTSGTEQDPYSRRGLVITGKDKQYIIPFNEINRSSVNRINQHADAAFYYGSSGDQGNYNAAMDALVTEINLLGSADYKPASIETFKQSTK